MHLVYCHGLASRCWVSRGPEALRGREVRDRLYPGPVTGTLSFFFFFLPFHFTSAKIIKKTNFSENSQNLESGVPKCLDVGHFLRTLPPPKKTQTEPYFFLTEYEPGYHLNITQYCLMLAGD